jgi:hypothetical protein
VHVDGSGLDVGLCIPDRFQQLRAGLHPSAPLNEGEEQFVFGGGQVELLTSDGRAMSGSVYGNRPRGQGRAGAYSGGAQPAKQTTHSEREFLRRERLGQVVVGPEREAAYTVGLLPPCRKEYDANLTSLIALSHLREHIVARDAGEHEIEDDDVRALFPGRLQSIGAIGGGGNPETCLGQVIGDERSNVRLVVYDENAVCHSDPML